MFKLGQRKYRNQSEIQPKENEAEQKPIVIHNVGKPKRPGHKDYKLTPQKRKQILSLLAERWNITAAGSLNLGVFYFVRIIFFLIVVHSDKNIYFQRDWFNCFC